MKEKTLDLKKTIELVKQNRYEKENKRERKTGTSQVGDISKAQIKSKGGFWRQKHFKKKSQSAEKPKSRTLYTHTV